MDRSKAEFNILDKITKERLARNWSEYTLAKNSEIPQSTISTWYRKDLEPSVASIERICKGLNITLSQFFSYEGKNNDLTADQQEILDVWGHLNDFQRKAIIEMIKSFLYREY